MIHNSTLNESFLKMANHLKSSGINNYDFFLKLNDETLEDLDPFANDLTKEQKARIICEIMSNPYYFFREIIRIPAPGGFVPFELHRGNLAIIYSILNNQNFCVMLPRQRYKTYSIICCLIWIYYFGTSNTSFLFSNKSMPDAQNNLKRFKDITAALPNFLHLSISDKDDVNNQQEIVSGLTNNQIKTSGNPNSPEHADKMARGTSTAMVWFDELAFLSYNDIVYTAAVPAIMKVAEIAKQKGRPHCIMISTTPNMADSPMGMFVKGMFDDACSFDEKFYDWTSDEIKTHIKHNYENDYISIVYTWKQLGLSEEWYREQCRALLNDRLKIRREIDLEWTKSQDNSVFNEEQLDYLHENVIEPITTTYIQINKEYGYNEIVDEKFKFNIYEPLDKEKVYFCGIDTAGGTARDYSTIVVVDPSTLRVVSTFKNNKINTSYFISLIRTFITEVIPRSYLFIESNSYGKNVIDTLLRTGLNNSIYFEYKIPDKHKKTIQVVGDNIKYGIDTTETSRNAMIDILFTIMKEEPDIFSVKELYNDISTLIYNKKGKVEHDINGHDDCLMAYLFVRYAIEYGNNIKRYYRTIDHSRKLTDIMFTPSIYFKQDSSILQNKTDEDDLKQLYASAMKDKEISKINIIKDNKTGNSKVNVNLLDIMFNANRR